MAIYRTQLLNLMTAALNKYKLLDGVTVYSPGDWPTDPKKGDAIQIGRKIGDHKSSVTRGQPEFNTVIYITVDGRLVRTSGEEALRDIEQLGWKIEQAILTSYDLNLVIQQFISVKTEQEVDSSTEMHVAQVTSEYGLEIFQSQEEYTMPVDPTQIDTLTVAIDSANIYDPSGTYANTPVTTVFPQAVLPAPRRAGPDGRAEGYTIIDLNQE